MADTTTIKPIAPLPLTMTEEEKAAKVKEIQTQITDLQSQVETATSALEKEKLVQAAVLKMAELGQAYPAEYVKAMTVPTKTEEEARKEVYTKYGISELEAGAFAAPTQTFETIYKKAYEESGLADIKTKMETKQTEINKATEDYNTELGKLNEDPWISEARRVGKNRVLTEMYDRRKALLDAEYTQLSNKYDTGKEAAENTATRALSELEAGRTRTKEELAYYVKRAEADIEAKATLAKTEEAKELYRYYPEYVKAVTKKEEITGWTLKQKANGEWVWMHPTKGEKPTGVKGKEAAQISRTTLNKLNAMGVKDDLALDIQQLFSLGYSEDQIRTAIKDAGYDPKLLDTFKDIVGKAGESIIIMPAE